MLVWPEIGRKEEIMSEFTKGELEENQSCCNSIDLISKEDGSIVAQITECEEDELSNIQRANAKELVRRWNSQPIQNQLLKDIYADAELLLNGRYTITKKRLQDINSAIAKATHKP